GPQVLILQINEGLRPGQRLHVGTSHAALALGCEWVGPPPDWISPKHLQGQPACRRRIGGRFRQGAGAPGLSDQAPNDGSPRVPVVERLRFCPSFPESVEKVPDRRSTD